MSNHKGGYLDTRFKNGHIPWNKGTKTTHKCKDCLKTISQFNGFNVIRCRSCEAKRRWKEGVFVAKPNSGQFKKGDKPWFIGKEQLLKRGEHHWNWQGGKSLLRDQVKHLSNYVAWRTVVFERDNYTCKLCGQRGGRLNADHYPKSFAALIIENSVQNIADALKCKTMWDINNGRTLCESCHKMTPSYLNRWHTKEIYSG